MHGSLSPHAIRHRNTLAMEDSPVDSPLKASEVDHERKKFRLEMEDWSKKLKKRVSTKSKDELSIHEEEYHKKVRDNSLTMSLRPVMN